MMRWFASPMMVFVTSLSAGASEPEQTKFECTLTPHCAVGMDCSKMLLLNLDAEETGENWHVTTWYGQMRSTKLELDYQAMPVHFPTNGDLYLQDTNGDYGDVFVNVLLIANDGGAYLSTFIGGHISGVQTYSGRCGDPI